MRTAFASLALLALAAAAPVPPVTVTCGEEAVAVCDQMALIERATRERDRVAAFLGLAVERPIAIHVGDSWRGRAIQVTQSWTEFGRIVIPTRILARGIAPTAHEMTHVLAGRGASNLLTEGLAVVAHARFGEQPAFPNFGVPLEQSLRQLLDRAPPREGPPRLAEIEDWIDDLEDPGHRRFGYLVAGLFSEFLLEDRLGGDRARFMRLYHSGDYRGILGETGDVLFARWWAGRAA